MNTTTGIRVGDLAEVIQRYRNGRRRRTLWTARVLRETKKHWIVCEHHGREEEKFRKHGATPYNVGSFVHIVPIGR